MALRVKRSKRSKKADRILRDPDAYFQAAREKARKQVEREMKAEQTRRAAHA